MQKNTPVAPRSPEASLWYDPSLSMKLGCTACPDLTICGGLRIPARVFDCRSLCSCTLRGGRCSGVCRRDPRTFVSRVEGVRGFGFESVPRCPPLSAPLSGEYIPIIYDGTSRCEPFDGGIVALPLLSLVNRVQGTARFATRVELLAAYRLAPHTRIILTGVAPDRPIETWWGFSDRARLIDELRPLGIEMVTAPNYSLFTDTTRYDNLHNMKRIAICWSEFMAARIPCALHVNARTDTDYRRWATFIAGREEVSHVAFEFTTGTATRARGAYHLDQLVRLAERVRRPLHLVLRGGRRHLRELTAAFESVSLLDAGPYIKTKYRHRASLAMGAEIVWRPFPTNRGEPLDELLRHNVAVKRLSNSMRLRWLRADCPCHS